MKRKTLQRKSINGKKEFTRKNIGTNDVYICLFPTITTNDQTKIHKKTKATKTKVKRKESITKNQTMHGNGGTIPI